MKRPLILDDYEKYLFDQLLSAVAYGPDDKIVDKAQELYANIYGVDKENLINIKHMKE